MSEPDPLFEVLAPSEVTTLVHGTTSLLSSLAGEIRPVALLGAFHRDERLLSALSVTVDGALPPLLAAGRSGSSSDRVASLAALDQYRNGQALLVRRRDVRDGAIREAIEMHSFGTSRNVELDLVMTSDGASILDLKVGIASAANLPWRIEADGRRASSVRHGAEFAVVNVDTHGSLWLDPTDQTILHASWKPSVAAGQAWQAEWSVSSAIATPKSSSAGLSRLTVVGDDHRWVPAVRSAIDDLEALIVELPERDLRFVGAGAPWFQALFGRDALITAWQALPLGTELALDVLDTLATFQGIEVLERTRQAPGKIPHEWRVGAPQVFGMPAGEVYYGTVDASALFVMLLAEAYRWGAPVDRVRELIPAARAALQWCRTDATVAGGRDRQPFVWYTPDPNGLGNQGWKDSGDCIVHADGTFAKGPIAMAEAQAYTYEALMGMARLERDLGFGIETATTHEADAAVLSMAFMDRFWLADERLLALALDGNGDPLRVASSNMGQCLWSGIIPHERVMDVVSRTMAPDLLSPWGIRTLGDRERAYNPLGYHLGTVWAHDTALIAAGMARHGFGEAFRTLTSGLLDAAEQFDWRLPELYGGLDTSADRAPLPYPAACSPQAWASGAPLLLLRSILGLDPDIPSGTVALRPLLAEGVSLNVGGLRVGDRFVSIAARGASIAGTSGLEGLTIVT
jgi:glycogen debranching enzyme